MLMPFICILVMLGGKVVLMAALNPTVFKSAPAVPAPKGDK